MPKSSKNNIKQIEKIINEDLSNGKHLSSKIKRKLIQSGYCIKTICKQLEDLKQAS